MGLRISRLEDLTQVDISETLLTDTLMVLIGSQRLLGGRRRESDDRREVSGHVHQADEVSCGCLQN